MAFDLKRLLAAAGAALFMNGLWADVPPPRASVTVFFTKDGQPYHSPVDFQVQCYGWEFYPNSQKERKPHFTEIYKYSGSCPDYGCTVNLARGGKPNYTTIDYCHLTGKTGGRSFKVEKFGKEPVGECKRRDDFMASWTMDCKLNLALPK